MFVRQSKYDKVRAELQAACTLAAVLATKLAEAEKENRKRIRAWNDLVDEVNAKGGREFLDGKTSAPQLTSDEITRLILLCHPDKHDGKPMAVTMTQRLLELKNNTGA